MDISKSVLLSKSEMKYLLSAGVLSISFQYKIRSQLKKKISIFLENEFPLLLESGLMDINDLQDYINKNHMFPVLGKEKVAGNCMKTCWNSRPRLWFS